MLNTNQFMTKTENVNLITHKTIAKVIDFFTIFFGFLLIFCIDDLFKRCKQPDFRSWLLQVTILTKIDW